MMGIVMDIRGKKAVVYCNNGQMLETANRNYQIGQRVRVGARPYVRYMAAAACFLMFCIAGFSGHHMYNTPESYIYLDINPSIRLDVNCFNRVIAAIPLNDDAEALLTDYPVKNIKADDCINYIVEACKNEKYISQENTDVQIGVMTDNLRLKSGIDTVSENLKRSNLVVEVSDVDRAQNERAIELNVSAKRLEALEEFAGTFGGDVNELSKALADVSNKDIYSRIEIKKSEAQPTEQPQSKNKPNQDKESKTNADGSEGESKAEIKSSVSGYTQKQEKAVSEGGNDGSAPSKNEPDTEKKPDSSNAEQKDVNKEAADDNPPAPANDSVKSEKTSKDETKKSDNGNEDGKKDNSSVTDKDKSDKSGTNDDKKENK